MLLPRPLQRYAVMRPSPEGVLVHYPPTFRIPSAADVSMARLGIGDCIDKSSAWEWRGHGESVTGMRRNAMAKDTPLGPGNGQMVQ